MSLDTLLADPEATYNVAVELDSELRSKLLSFPGASGNHVDFGDILDQGASDSFTVEILFATSTAGTLKALATKRNGTGAAIAGWRLDLNTSNQLVALISDTSASVFVTPDAAAFLDGQPHRASMVVDRSAQEIRLYVDGSLLATSTSTAAIGTLTNTISMRLGDFGTAGTSPFNGKLWDYRFWTVARTEAQIRASLLTPLAGTETGLAINAPMQEGEGIKVYDVTSNARHGTITGTTWADFTKTWRFSFIGVPDNKNDTGGPIYPYLKDLPAFQFALAEDPSFSGLASATLGSVTLNDTSHTGLFNSWVDYTFSGQAARVKIGKVTDAYSAWITYRVCTQGEIEPKLTGLKATTTLESALGRLLQEPLTVRRYVGFPTCIRFLTATGSASATKIAAYDTSVFTIMCRFRMTAAPAAVRRLVTKFNSVSPTTDSQFLLRLETTGKVLFFASSAGAADINFTSSAVYTDGAWHSLVFGRDSATTAFAMLDGVLLQTFTPAGAPNLTNAAVVMGVSAGGDDLDLCDVRFYDRYIAPDEARGLASVRVSGSDLGIVGLWPCTDNSGGTINDESANNNDATLAGVLNTDYSWQAADLGPPELAGSVQPVILGVPFNTKADLIDDARERYRIADEDVVTGGESQTIRSRGTTLTGGGTDYSDEGGGIIQMVAAEDEPVTVDVVSASPTTFANQWPALLTGVLSARAGISPNATQELTLPNLLPWNAGYYFQQEMTAAEIAAELAKGGISLYADAADALFLDFLLPPLGLGPYGEPCLDLRGDFAYWNFGDIADCTSTHCTVACCWKTFAVNQGPSNYGVTASEQSLVDKIIAGTAGYALDYVMTGTNAGKIRFRIKGSGSPASAELLSPAGLVEEGRWYFTVGVFDDTANTMAIFHGRFGAPLVQVASATGVTSTIGNSAEALTVGANVWGSAGYMQVWNVAKNLAQMQALMLTPPVGNESNLLAFAPMNEGTGTTVSEKVASGTGTITTDYPRWRWAPKLTVNLDETPSVTLEGYHLLQPVYKMDVRFGRNWLPMTDADIDSGVSQSTRLALKRPWQSVPWENTAIRAKHNRSKNLTFDTPLMSRVDAQRLLRLLAARYSVGRSGGDLMFPAYAGSRLPASRKALGMGFGDEVRVISSQHKLSGGKSFRVTSMRPHLLEQSARLGIWG